MTSDRETKLRRWWSLAVFGAAVAVYLPTLGHGFVFDDDVLVVRNEVVHEGSLARLFSTSHWEGAGLRADLYRPIPAATYALDHALWGLDPLGYHLTNLLLHALAALLLLWLAWTWRLPALPAGLAGLAFALHPIHVEVAAHVAGRKDVLVTVFLLAALLAHARWRRGGDARWLLLAPLFLAAGLFSKENAIVGLGLLPLQDLLIDRREPVRWRRLAALYGAYALVTLGWAAARWSVVGALASTVVPFLDNPLVEASLTGRWMTALAVLGRGLGALVWPTTLSPDYSFDALPVVRSALDPGFVGSLLLLGLLTWLAARNWRARPAVTAGLLFWAGAIFPTSNLLLVIGTIYGERLLYLPSAGIALAAAALLPAELGIARPRGKAILALAAGLLLAWSARNLHYSAAWESEATLFAWAARAVPGSAKVHHKLGERAMAEGRHAEAEAAFARALAIHDEAFQTHRGRAAALRGLGRLAEAEAALRRVVELRGDDPASHYELASLYRDLGRLEDARPHWEKTLALDPAHAGALGDLGSYRHLQGDTAGAVVLWSRAALADPSNATTFYNLGLGKLALGDRSGAREAWTHFLRLAGPELAPQRAEVERRLGNLAAP
ncbi:MAG: tetratricopeptide repeat protein [Deltaproteobacteria bacterium]|nr:tetratricopeptide repeat protein [Deltaproteobacteria bacterium]